MSPTHISALTSRLFHLLLLAGVMAIVGWAWLRPQPVYARITRR